VQQAVRCVQQAIHCVQQTIFCAQGAIPRAFALSESRPVSSPDDVEFCRRQNSEAIRFRRIAPLPLFFIPYSLLFPLYGDYHNKVHKIW
jgi:hypothetical protein